MEWKPIETAPEYITVLTKHEKDLFPVCAFYALKEDGTRFWMRIIEGPEDVMRSSQGDHGALYRPPTHWLSLDELPRLDA